jgi:soluble lytic murein transglycosylase
LKRTVKGFRDFLLLLIVIAVCAAGYAYVNRYYYRAAYPVHFRGTVEGYSEENGLPPSLVFAVIWTESGFNPRAESSVGARGLMQITADTMSWTAYRLGEEEPDQAWLFRGEENIKYGAALLRLLTEEFGTLENALCAYHAGYGNVERWLANPVYAPDGEHVTNIPFGDTKRYVQRVMETREMYRKLYGIE